jgi:prevent-host-death family protein
MTTEIGAFDAKTRLPQLLREVEAGARYIITHRGKAIAELVPVQRSGLEARQQAVDSLLAMPRLKVPQGQSIKDWVNEGRR